MNKMSQNNNQVLPIRLKHGGISLDILWALIILAGFLFFASLVPLPPNDFWWHLKTGEYIFINHTIPTTNIYAWTLPVNQPFYYAAWLAELLFYFFYRLGGLALIISMRTILIGVTMWLVAAEAHHRSGSWRISALVIAMLSLMITNNLIVRTQIWAWLPFITTYIVLKRYTDGTLSWRWLLFCPACMILWVNVHGSFILGLILPGAFFLGEAVSNLFKQLKALNWHQIGWIGCTGLLSGLAVLINPRFTGIVSYTINLLTNPPSQQLIEEWQSPTPKGLSNIFFFISILIFIIALAYSKYRPNITEIILFVGFLWLAWSGQRYVIWYGVISMPILARLIKDFPIKAPAFIPQKNWLNLALAILVFIPAIAVQPWFVERLPLPNTYWQQVLRGSKAGRLIGIDTPVAAADYLKSNPGGHLFNEMGYGSYLIWAVPKQGVFIDPRVELFPYDQWMDYIRVNNATNYNEILTKYGVDRILLDKKLQPNLAASLPKDQQWKLDYDDQYAQIWSKISAP
jgi:hypothetical protein